MTTHPILSYPINPGLKEFQFFQYNGEIYYLYGYKTRIIVLDHEFRTIQTIQTTLQSDITCLSLRHLDGTIAVSSFNIVSIFRLNDYKFQWDFALNLTLGFNVAYLCFGNHKYLSVVGNQLTIWEEIILSSNGDNNDDHGQSRVWLNVYSNTMPRPFKFVKFSPCETMFATSEINGFPMIKIWYIQDRSFSDTSVRSKIVRFGYVPKKFDNPHHFFWVKIDQKSILCTIQSNLFYFWEFDCSFASIKSTILLEFNFQSKSFVFENLCSSSNLYFFNEVECFIKLMNIKDLRHNFVHFTDLVEKMIDISNRHKYDFSGFYRYIISGESESSLNLIGLGNRNVSSLEFKKDSSEISVQKTWSFVSDKITILFESGGYVFFLNSEKLLCVTNSKNQAMVKILSDLMFDQIVLFSDGSTNSNYLLALRNSKLIILELSGCDILRQWDIDYDFISSPITIRGKYFISNSHEKIIILQFHNESDPPYNIFEITQNYDSVDVLQFDEDSHSLTILGYTHSETEGAVCTFSKDNFEPQEIVRFKDQLLSQSKNEYGRYLCFSVNQKLFRSTKFDIAKNIYSFQNICRNMYGNVLQLKYYEDSFGVGYFLSLHQKYFLVFIIGTTKSGALETSLVKSISIPENEFTGNSLEILLTGTNEIYIRDDSNAYKISIDTEIDKSTLLDYSIPLNISSLEFVLTMLSRQDFNRIEYDHLLDSLSFKIHRPIFEYSLNLVKDFKGSIDILASKAIFLATLRYKFEYQNLACDFLKEISEYEILLASRSDSQNVLIDAFSQICGGKMSFKEFKFFKFPMWVKNTDSLKALLEKVARTEFASESDNFDLPTLIYVLLGKIKAAAIIWNRSKNPESQKLQLFLNSDFEKEENRLKAEKNAFALIGKQRFELALAFFILANKIEDARQLAKKMSVEYRMITCRICNLDDNIPISKQLSVKIDNGLPEILIVDKTGICSLYLLEKSKDTETVNEHVKIFIEFLLQNGAIFLALFIMQSYKIFNNVASKLAIENAIAINSKILNEKNSLLKNKIAELFGSSLITARQDFRRQFELNEESNASSEQHMYW